MSSSSRRERYVFRSEVESKHLICSVCSDTFIDPIITNCGHTFCRQCIQQSIDNNNSRCAECRKPFVKKRNRRQDTDLVVVSNYVFSRNIIVNSMIDELMTKCDFDFNGCQEIIKFQTLSSHLKQCEFRICKTCGFKAGTTDQHNCFELMKSNRNEWKTRSEDLKKKSDELNHQIVALKEKVSSLNKQLHSSKTNPFSSMVSNLKFTDDCSRKIESVVIGNCRTAAKNLEIFSNGLKICYVKGYDDSNWRQHIKIPFHCIQNILYCTDKSLSAIALKPFLESSQQINQSFFGTDPPKDIKLDIQSKGITVVSQNKIFKWTLTSISDTKHWYIIVVFKDDCQLFFSLIHTIFLVYGREYDTQTECEAIDSNIMRDIIKKSIN